MYRSWYGGAHRDYSSSYPSYGYGYPYSGYSGYSRNRFGSYGSYSSSPSCYEYRYGGRRRRPYYWERDNEFSRDFRRRRRRNRRRRRREEPVEPRDESPESPEPPKPEPKPEVPEEDLAKVLHVKKIDWNIKINTRRHNTNKFNCTHKREWEGKELEPELLVRRGDFVLVDITFDRKYNIKENDLEFKFTLGPDPTPSKGTLVSFPLDEKQTTYKHQQWGAYLKDILENTIQVMLYIPANSIVGEWNCFIKTFDIGKDAEGKEITKIYQFECDEDMLVLFNPWCKYDTCYMPTTDLLKEYVLNPTGCVYRGSSRNRGAKDWNYGQFEELVIECALLLLRMGFKGGVSRHQCNPVNVSRVIAKMVNSSDDNGVLTGNWSGNYEGGTSPTKWCGSVKILRQYYNTRQPVLFGQCWVFSAVTTTVMRALGIPCRSVTNFASAHDTDGSCSIDKYFKRVNGKLEKAHMRGSSDSTWNFHVWNEAWFARPDLGQGCDGWQVIDATPQELSDGVYTCGPCPVSAIKKGLVQTQYDCEFIFAEVNADTIHWEILPGGDCRRLRVDKEIVGQYISTKIGDGKPFKDENYSYWNRDKYAEDKRDDITCNYKYPEGSEEERASVMKAHQLTSRPLPGAYTSAEPVKKIKFKWETNDQVMVGSDLPLKLRADNVGTRDRFIKSVEIRVYPEDYTGSCGPLILREICKPQEVKKGAHVFFERLVKTEEYLGHIVEQCSLAIEAEVCVESVADEEEQDDIIEDIHRFRRPDLDVECFEKGKLGDFFGFEVKFTNPLPKPLTKCSISMESDGFKDIDDEDQADVPPGGQFKYRCKLKSFKPGEICAVYSFDSAELQDITGSCSVHVKKY